MATAYDGIGSGAPPLDKISRVTVLGWLALFFAAGVYIRIQEPFYSFTYNNDEFILMGIVNGRTLKEVLHFALYDTHPPLYYILAHYWSLISNSQPFMRSLQLIMGMAMVPLYYVIGKRIGGPLMGLCCAGLVTFSFGAVVQSYIMRQYCVLALMLSLNFYYYIRWRTECQTGVLIGYVITGWLAVLSHFYSDFYFLTLLIFEIASLCFSHERLTWRKIIAWLMANFAIGLLIVYIYWLWSPTLNYSRHRDVWLPPPLKEFILEILISPFSAASYIYPSPYPLLPFALFYLFFGISPQAVVRLRPYLVLGGIVCIVSMAIYGFGLFPWQGTRHCMWMFPMLIVPMGGLLADILERRIAQTARFPKKAIFALIAIAVFCDTGRRLVDEDYPGWQRGTLQAISQTLGSLGPSDLFITDKDGLNLLSNMQPYKTDEAFMNGDMPVLAPYKNTHMLIDPNYFGIFSPKAVRDMMAHAEAAHLLDGIDRIVIVKMWNKWPYYPLVTCRTLPRNFLLTVPENMQEQFYPETFAVMTISKKVFFDEVMSPSGNSLQCLNPEQDTIPEWYYLPRTAKHTAH